MVKVSMEKIEQLSLTSLFALAAAHQFSCLESASDALLFYLTNYPSPTSFASPCCAIRAIRSSRALAIRVVRPRGSS